MKLYQAVDTSGISYIRGVGYNPTPRHSFSIFYFDPHDAVSKLLAYGYNLEDLVVVELDSRDMDRKKFEYDFRHHVEKQEDINSVYYRGGVRHVSFITDLSTLPDKRRTIFDVQKEDTDGWFLADYLLEIYDEEFCPRTIPAVIRKEAAAC